LTDASKTAKMMKGDIIQQHIDIYFARDVFFFRQVLSEVPRSIAVKLFHMIGNWFD